MLPHGFGDPQGSLQPCPRFPRHDLRFAPLGLSFGSLVYRLLPTRRPATAFVQRGSGVWDLTSDARTGLSLFLPGPQPVSQLGRNPRRRSSHRVVANLATSKSTRRLASLARVAVFQVFVAAPTLASHSSQNGLLSIQRRHPQTGGCPWLSPRTSTTFPLPLDSSSRPCC